MSLKRAKKVSQFNKDKIKNSASGKVAIALAMRAASAAAITGSMTSYSSGKGNPVYGADPRVVEHVGNTLRSIFAVHGAVEIEAPLLRPRENYGFNASGGAGNYSFASSKAEVMDETGQILVLNENLTASFARAVSRAGASTGNLKRFCFGKCFFKSSSSNDDRLRLHPREQHEASFDIVHDKNDHNNEDHNLSGLNYESLIEAETIIVCMKAMAGLRSTFNCADDLFWGLKLTNTLLSDSLLTLCCVGEESNVRKSVLKLLSYTASTHKAYENVSIAKGSNPKQKKGGLANSVRNDILCKIEELEDQTNLNPLSHESAERLRVLFEGNLLPLAEDPDAALRSIEESAYRVKKSYERGGEVAPKKVVKALQRCKVCIQNLQKLLVLCKMGGVDLSGRSDSGENFSPSVVTFDLGMRQKEKHYDGGLYYQSVLFSSSRKKSLNVCFNEGLRVCEGGRYDDLVGKYRPPNVITRDLPIACGVRFLIGRIVESFYLVAQEKKLAVQKGGINKYGPTEALHVGLGVPFFGHGNMVNVIVAGLNGLALCPAIFERWVVASRLWSSGIGAEYLVNSSVIGGILLDDLNLDQLCGALSLMRIRFVVIVKKNTLREKGVVKCRELDLESGSYTETEVALQNIVSTIKSCLSSDEDLSKSLLADETSAIKNAAGATDYQANSSGGSNYDFDLVLVSPDYKVVDPRENPGQNLEHSHRKKVETGRKAAMGIIDSIVGKGGACGKGRKVGVVMLNLPFLVLREVATGLIGIGFGGIDTVCDEVNKKFDSVHVKKTLKAIKMSVQILMNRIDRGAGGAGGGGEELVTLIFVNDRENSHEFVTLRKDGGGTFPDLYK